MEVLAVNEKGRRGTADPPPKGANEVTTHSTTMTLENAAAICHAPVKTARAPKGCEPCEQCPGYSELYAPLPKCTDCGLLVCAKCVVPDSVVADERRPSCLCRACERRAVAKADYEADGDLDTAALHREEE